MFIDDDMVCPEDTIIRLIETDKDIVSGFCCQRERPFYPCAFNNTTGLAYESLKEWPEDSLVKVDAVGGACMLVKTDIFRKVKRPWFHFYSNSELDMGEDIYFCRKANRKGYDIWLDTGLIIGHIGDCAFTVHDYLAFREQQEESQSAIITRRSDKSSLITPVNS
jgi:GT2 family glycosyltransferase